MQLPSTLTITSKQLKEGTRLDAYMKSLEKKKKKTPGKQVSAVEVILSSHSLHNCKTPSELEKAARIHRNYQDAIRSFYHSNSQCKTRRRFEWTKERYLGLCCIDRVQNIQRQPSRYVHHGHWEKRRLSRYTPTTITNEYNSSQTYLYCFEELFYPSYAKDNAIKITNDTSICLNQRCFNTLRSVYRDQVSALVIGLASVAQLVFGATFPCFDEDANHQSHIKFMDLALSFLKWKQG